jgi:hypothetical protein
MAINIEGNEKSQKNRFTFEPISVDDDEEEEEEEEEANEILLANQKVNSAT